MGANCSLIVETVALVAGLTAWWRDRRLHERQELSLEAQGQRLEDQAHKLKAQMHRDNLTRLQAEQRQAREQERERERSHVLMLLVAEPEPVKRARYGEHMQRVVNEPDEAKRQEHLDSVAVHLSVSFLAEGGGSVNLSGNCDDDE